MSVIADTQLFKVQTPETTSDLGPNKPVIPNILGWPQGYLELKQNLFSCWDVARLSIEWLPKAEVVVTESEN